MVPFCVVDKSVTSPVGLYFFPWMKKVAKKSAAVVLSAKILVAGLDHLNSALQASDSRWSLTPCPYGFLNAFRTNAANLLE